MSSNSPVRRKTKGWVRLCSCFGASDQTSPDEPTIPPQQPLVHRVSHGPSSAATRLPDAKEDVYNTASALTTDGASPVEPSDDTAVLLQPQLTSTESAKTSSSNCDLWDKALRHLQESKEDKGIVAIVERFAESPAADNTTPKCGHSKVKVLAKDIKEKMEQEINSKQHDSETRCFVEKTVSVLNKFLSVGDVAVSFDPIHAALPWAAVRFVLVTVTAGSELRSQQLAGLAKATSLVSQCDTYQQLYMAPDPSLRPLKDVLYTLETSIVYAYAKLLLFLGFVIQCQQSKSKRVDAPFKLGSMEEYVKSLSDSGDGLAQAADNCEKQCNYLNRSTVKGLHDLAEESHKAVRDQAKLVLDIHQKIVLAELHTAKGAAFDSLANQNDDKCHPGTRVALLKEIYKWADSPDGDCIFWLQGMAGTGKSTISRTVAHRLAEKGELGASFFFKRGQSDRGKAARFFTTIAAQLARQLPPLAPHIQAAIKADSDIGEKAMTEQFDKLVLQPLEKAKCDPRNPWRTMVVVVDALDECDREEDATTIIGLLPRAKKLSSVRLKFFITSRPEFPILLQFDKISGTYQDLALHKVDKYTIEHDISIFFESELSKIKDDYNRLAQKDWKLSLDWPGRTNLQILVKRAVPLFIFAKTVCRFVEDRGFGDPEEQLNKILEYQSTEQEFQLHATYLPVLSQMLMKRTAEGLISRSAEEKAAIVKEFCEVVGTIVILAEPLPIGSLSQLLRIPKRTTGHRLSMLHSVLNIPSDSATPVKLFHLSFRDFLVDPKNREANLFWVDEEKTHERLATKCLNLLSERNYLKKDICGLQMPGKRREEIKQKTILECLPSEVQYACLYWIYHLKGSKRKVRDGDEVHQFLERYLLQWLEALSLIGRISESIGLIDRLQSLTDPATAVKISSFLHDAKRFILNCRLVIDLAPLQLYSSALVFAPEESVVRNTFQHFMPSWIAPKPVMKRNWGSCIQTLEGHRNLVSSVAFSADSKLVVSGSHDSSIKIWDAATGREMQTLEGHRGWVRSVAFSADSKLVVSGSGDSTIKIWDAATGREMQTLEGHRDSVTSVAFSADSKLVVSGSGDSTIKIWDVATGREMQILEGHRNSVWSVAFSADSKLVVSGSGDSTIKIWDAATGREMQTLEGHRDEVWSVAFSADSKLVVSGSGDSTIKIWDAATGQEMQTLEGHRRSVTSVAFSTDSKLVVSGSRDSTIKIWDAATGREMQTLKGHRDWVWSIAFSTDSKLVVSGSRDSTIKIWDAATGREMQTLEGHRDRVSSVVFSADSELVVSGSDDSTIKIWDVATGREMQTLEGHRYMVLSVAFSADSKLVVSGSGDSAIKIWDAATGQEMQTLEGHRDSVSSVAFSADSKLVVSGSYDSTIKIWDAATGREMQTLEDRDWVISAAFSADSKLVVSGSSDSTIKIWDAATGREMQTLESHRDSVWSVAFSADSKLVVSGSSDSTMKIWDAATGREIRTLAIGTILRNISFDITGAHLNTNIGVVVLDTLLALDTAPRAPTQGYGLSSDRIWITWDSENLLWLPTEYRPQQSAVSASTVVIGCVSGRVLIFKFSVEETPVV